MPHDLSEYEVPLAEFIRSTYVNPDDYPLEVWQEDARQLLASPVVAQLLADERERIAQEIALRIEQTPAEEWGQPLHVGDTPEQGFYNGANAAIRFAAQTARKQAACSCPTDAEIRAAIHHSHQQLTGGNTK